MRIAIIGGGPAGLYFAISMKLRDSAHDIDVFERNAADSTFGWGVVFSDQTVENLIANDPVSAQTIADEFAHWDDIDVHFGGQTITSSGHGFIGIDRKRMLAILQDRARELGVSLHFEHEASDDLVEYADYDLVIAADGANSRLRTRYEPHFGVDIASSNPVYGRMFQTPFSDLIRNEGDVRTMAVGNICEADHVNSILAAGRADLVAMARPHLVEPYWTLHAAAAAGYRGVAVPKPYQAGQQQLTRNLKRAAEMEAVLKA